MNHGRAWIRVLLQLLLVAAIPCAAWGQTDEEQVRAAAVSSARAMRGEDLDALKACMIASESGWKIWEGEMRRRRTMSEFGDALIERFGAPARMYVLWMPRPWRNNPSTDIERAGTAPIKVNGDRATMQIPLSTTSPNVKTDVTFKRDGGKWKRVDNTQLAQGLDPATAFKTRDAVIAEVQTLTARVRAGRLATLDDADLAFYELQKRHDLARLPRTRIDNHTGRRVGEDDESIIVIGDGGPDLVEGAGTAGGRTSAGTQDGTRPRMPKTLSGAAKVLDQMAYEQLLIACVQRLPADRSLDEGQRAKVAALEKEYQVAEEHLRVTRKAETDALMKAFAQIQQGMVAAGGDANPNLLTAELEAHVPILSADLDLQRRRRTDLSSLLTPAQRQSWWRIAVSDKMRRELQNARFTPERQAALDAAIDEATIEAARLPADAGLAQLQGCVHAAWLKHAVDILGLPATK